MTTTDGSSTDDSATGGSGDDEPSDSRIETAIRDNHPALITYLTAGDPGLDETRRYVEALDRGGADVIELGLPFSEPVAEGPTIQAAITRALEAGTTPEGFFDLVDALDTEAPLVCMTYTNLLMQYGPADSGTDVEPFVERAAEAGLDGLIVPDLPAAEARPLREACDSVGLDLISIVAPTTADERLETLMSTTSGFAYVQARLGTTGARTNVSGATHESLARLDGYDVPTAVGFGVSEPEHAAEIVAGGADGVIVGSALVDLAATSDDPERDLEAKARELKRGAADGLADRELPASPEPERS
ncbi:tryptophan synthase subunit alpha [Halovivax asiaticus JCM 14624]|uniref:Tryptophan synthase alpha chain n=1 Tax=Halovivax asiaticus JCM 14624 TaxID=1227490 RepID=M0BD58_9EURY|nr:tryptophan synthase subunit alpha [Halovivax asiaticus]ELZ08238.1 tryptophan synthase subunit alpha [Halovivax asiaticus JCM 14624]